MAVVGSSPGGWEQEKEVEALSWRALCTARRHVCTHSVLRPWRAFASARGIDDNPIIRSYNRETRVLSLSPPPALLPEPSPLHATNMVAFDSAQSAGQPTGQGSTSCSLIASQQLSNAIIGEGYVPNPAGLAWEFLIRNWRFGCWGRKPQSAVNM